MRSIDSAMSTLDASSDLDAIKAAYKANASYAEDGSVSKCRAFLTACELWLLEEARQVSDAHGSVRTSNADIIERRMRAAEQWLSVNDTTTVAVSKTRQLGISRGFRG